MTLLLQLTATYNLSADGLSWDNINFMVCLWNSLHIVTIFSINLFLKKKEEILSVQLSLALYEFRRN